MLDMLTTTISHLPALMVIGECYLALPSPDANFVPDLQTSNFSSRLFELYLLACFREQGLSVRQDRVSPDFLIEKDGDRCWVEAVTANSEIPQTGGIGDWVHAPEDRAERLTGGPAERFAKTLRGKLQGNYHELAHVKGQSFALAVTDFHESGSMVWSREALPTYLYGLRADIQGEGQERHAVGTPITNLTGKHGIPAGLFRDPNFAHLSAVIFSNTATLAKFNRMGFLAGWRPSGLTMIQRSVLFDRTQGALEPIVFELVVGSDEYKSLGPVAKPGARNWRCSTIRWRLIPYRSISSRGPPIGSSKTAELSAALSGRTRSSHQLPFCAWSTRPKQHTA